MWNNSAEFCESRVRLSSRIVLKTQEHSNIVILKIEFPVSLKIVLKMLTTTLCIGFHFYALGLKLYLKC